MEKSSEKSKTPLASEADYIRVNGAVTLEIVKLLAGEMGAKKFSFSAALTVSKKADCITDFKREKQLSLISRDREVPSPTVSRWFKEYKNK